LIQKRKEVTTSFLSADNLQKAPMVYCIKKAPTSLRNLDENCYYVSLAISGWLNGFKILGGLKAISMIVCQFLSSKDQHKYAPKSFSIKCVFDGSKQCFLVFYNADILRIYRKPVFAGLRFVAVYDIALPCAKVKADSSLDGIGNIFSRVL
jgi:hypothetical protein